MPFAWDFAQSFCTKVISNICLFQTGTQANRIYDQEVTFRTGLQVQVQGFGPELEWTKLCASRLFPRIKLGHCRPVFSYASSTCIHQRSSERTRFDVYLRPVHKKWSVIKSAQKRLIHSTILGHKSHTDTSHESATSCAHVPQSCSVSSD